MVKGNWEDGKLQGFTTVLQKRDGVLLRTHIGFLNGDRWEGVFMVIYKNNDIGFFKSVMDEKDKEIRIPASEEEV
jgi:hypothetical protein